MQHVKLINSFNKTVYLNLIRPICFKKDPEKIHNLFIKIGKVLANSNLLKKTTSIFFNYQNPSLEQTILGIKFKNPVGLPAGFDKNVDIVNLMENVGFGFSEIGSVTAKPSLGNAGLRMKRIPKEKALWVNMGLNNIGAIKIKEKLDKIRENTHIPIGINIAKTNCKETVNPKNGVEDYIFSLNVLKNSGDYIVLNVSCPNAYGGQPFTNPKLFQMLIKEVDKLKIRKPLFVKLSPDINKKDLNRIIDLSKKHNVKGFICSNLTKKDKKSGGYSGKILENKSNDMLAYLYKKTNGKFIIIGVGGIFSAEDAYKKIKLGANLVQLITGMIYLGPSTISEINYGLTKLLKKDKYNNISEAIGKAVS